jgi:uncharacterized membrane protein YgcG
LIALSLLLAIFSVPAAFPGPAFSDERILEMNVTGTVGLDASLAVTEVLKIRAEGAEIRRGIIRVFPTDYIGADSKRYGTRFSLISAAMDGRGTPAEVTRSGGSVEIRIGDPNAFLSRGVHTIELKYYTVGWLAFRESFDELYWNVTGTDWSFPIDLATFRLVLPEGAAVSRSTAFTGRSGGRGSDFQTGPDGVISTTRTLQPGEGLTVVFAWNKGVVVPRKQSAASFTTNLVSGRILRVILSVLLITVYYASAWYLVGRDPSPRRIVPLYRPPKDVTPGFARYLKDMEFSNDCLAADIMRLATLGFVTFSEDSVTSDLVVTPTKSDDRTGGLPESLRSLLAALASGLGKHGISVNEANGDVWDQASKALEKVYKGREREYFSTNTKLNLIGLIFFIPFLFLATTSRSMMFGYFALAIRPIMMIFQLILRFGARPFYNKPRRVFIALIVVAVVIAASILIPNISHLDVPLLCGILSSLAITVFFSRIMSARTVKGTHAMEEIMGLEMYMNTAERYRMAMIYKPDETPKLFEELLPYAFALGVAETWADSFAGVLASASYRPEWDRTGYQGGIRTWRWSPRLSRDLSRGIGSSVSSHLAKQAAERRSSSYRGGSGFGGSVGGGGGGGGGRGW